MTEDLKSKTELPATWVVQVCEMRSGAPWPVASLPVRDDGHVTLQGVPGIESQIYMPLLAATKKAMAALTRATLLKELQVAGLLSKPEQISPALLPEAVAPAGRIVDVSPVDGAAVSPVTEGGTDA